MTHFRMTTQSTRPWDAATSADTPHRHARDGRPRHHAAGSLPMSYIVLLSATVLIVLAAAIVVALG
jgi:Ca2+/H+ antiporter